MAGIKQVSFTDPYAADEMEIARRQKLAEMLQQQSSTPLETNRMAGGWAVPISPFEGAAKLAQGAVGGYQAKQVEDRQRSLQEQMQRDRSSALAAALGKMQGQPASYEDAAGNYAPQPAQQPNPQAAMMDLAQSNDPSLRQAGTAGLISKMMPKPIAIGKTLVDANNPSNILAVDQTYKDELQANREAKAKEEEAKRIAAQEARQSQQDFMHNENRQRAADRAALAQMAASGGKVPPGYRQTPDGNLQAIPGGPADLKIQGQLNQDTQVLNGTTAALDRLAASANEVLQHPGLAGSFGLRGAIPNIPGTNAADATAKLQALQAQVGFNALQEMRNASKTGGALGSVSDKEHALLQSQISSLSKAQSVEQARENLAKVIKYTEDAKDRLQKAYNMKHSAQPAGNPAVDDLLKKYGG